MPREINSLFFKPVLQYNQANIQKINEICAPLKDCFGITSFGYCRALDGGRYIFISNCPIILKVFTCYDYILNTKVFRPLPQYFSMYEPYKFGWPENTRDELIEGMNAQGVFNGFNIIRNNAGTWENYFFATNEDSPLIKNFYASHFSVLEDFIDHFNKVAGKLIDTSNITRQGILPYFKDNYHQIETVFHKRTTWEDSIDKFNSLLNSSVQAEIYELAQQNSLTKRELQCLSYLSAGNTAKEIARTLNIGHRTVETHINSIRLKTSCQTKKELTHWFEEKFKHILVNYSLPSLDGGRLPGALNQF